nr:O-antigen ligase family protein [Candidatus Doudnabacteria bacterium]
MFMLVWAIALFASRGAILATAIGMVPVVVWFIWRRRWVQGFVLVLAIVLSVWIFSGTFLLYRGQEATVLVTAQDSSAVDRYVAWDVARDLVSKHPWFGYGPASFQQYYWEHLPSGLMAEGLYFDDAHNTLLHIMAAIGIPGVILFALVIALAVARGVSALWHGQAEKEEWVIVAAAGTVGAWIVGSSFNPVTPALYMQLALALGLLYGVGSYSHASVSISLKPFTVYIVRCIGVILLTYGFCMMVGNHLFIVAARHHARQQFTQSYTYTRLAVHIDPLSPLLQVARVATMQSADVPLPEVRSAIRGLLTASWATSPRTALQIADIAGQLYIASGVAEDQELVERALEVARMHGPTYPDAYVQSAYYAVSFGNVDEAVRHGQRGVLLQSKNYLTWLVMARAYQAAGNYAGLLLSLQKAEKLRPHDKQLPVLRRHLEETKDLNSINLLSQKTFVLLSLQ